MDFGLLCVNTFTTFFGSGLLFGEWKKPGSPLTLEIFRSDRGQGQEGPTLQQLYQSDGKDIFHQKQQTKNVQKWKSETPEGVKHSNFKNR